jgi:hypothetical protein
MIKYCGQTALLISKFEPPSEKQREKIEGCNVAIPCREKILRLKTGHKGTRQIPKL